MIVDKFSSLVLLGQKEGKEIGKNLGQEVAI
jgi:hypothetical protein